MSLKQISVFLENKPGKMLLLTDALARNNVNMRALSLAETSEFGIARIIVDDVYAASTLLKEEGFVHSVTKVLGVEMPNEPGGLNRVLKVLSDAGINVEYMYAFPAGRQPNQACMIFHVQDYKAAAVALAQKGFRCVDQQDLDQI